MNLPLSEVLGQPTCHTEYRVENVHHVIGSIGDSTGVGILLVHTTYESTSAKACELSEGRT
jgi:hypothetical protein